MRLLSVIPAAVLLLIAIPACSSSSSSGDGSAAGGTSAGGASAGAGGCSVELTGAVTATVPCTVDVSNIKASAGDVQNFNVLWTPCTPAGSVTVGTYDENSPNFSLTTRVVMKPFTEYDQYYGGAMCTGPSNNGTYTLNLTDASQTPHGTLDFTAIEPMGGMVMGHVTF